MASSFLALFKHEVTIPTGTWKLRGFCGGDAKEE